MCLKSLTEPLNPKHQNPKTTQKDLTPRKLEKHSPEAICAVSDSKRRYPLPSKDSYVKLPERDLW